MLRLDTLFVAIRSDTADFERGIKGVGRELDRLGDLIRNKPAIAAGAFASSLLLVGAAATKMAAEVDTGVKRATASMPLLRQHTADLRRDIKELSKETGISQAALADAYSTAAKTGVKSFSELQQVVRTAVTISEATGEDLTGIIGGLDAALDSFNLSAADTAAVGAKLYAATQGRFGFTELTEALKPLVPLIKIHKLSLDDTIGAYTRLLADENASPKQAAKQLKLMAEGGAEGAARMHELAGQAISTSDAIARMNTAAALSRESAGKLSEILHAELNAALIDLGNKILPTVVAELKGAVGLMDLMSSTIRDMNREPAARSLETIAAAFDKLSPTSREQELKRLRDAILDVLGTKGFGGALDDVQRITISLNGQLGKLPTDQLQALYRGLTVFARDLPLEKFLAINQVLANIGKELSTRGVTGIFPKGLASTGASETAGGGGNGFQDPDAVAAAKAAAKRAAEALADLREQARIALAGVSSEFDAGYTKLVIDLEKKIKAAAAAGRLAADEAQRLADRIKEIFRNKGFLDDLDHRVEEQRKKDEEAFKNEQAKRRAADAERKQAAQDARALADFNQRMLEKGKQVTEQLAGYQRDALAETIALGRAWEQVGIGILEAVTAAGGLDESTTAILSNAISLAGSVREFATEFKNFQSGAKDLAGKDLSSQLSVLQAAIPIIGSIGSLVGSLFGPDPEEAERKQLQRENNEQLRRLRESINDFRQLSLTGREFSTLSGQLNDPAQVQRLLFGAANERRSTSDRFGILSGKDLFNAEDFRRAGISLEDFRQAASDLGVSLKEGLPTINEVKAVGEALKAAEFNRFAKSFSGQLEKLEKGFTLFSTSDSGKFTELVDLLTSEEYGAPAIFDALKGIDISKPEGIDQARQAIQGIFSSFEDFDATDFGGLTPEQFFALLDELFGLLPKAAGAAAASADDVKALNDSLRLRTLAATGQDEAFEAEQRRQRRAAEIADAIAQGFDDEAIAALRATQALEDERVAKDAATKSTEAAAEQAKRQAEANEALIVRQLRAQGLDQEAEDVQRAHDQLQEILDATAAGFDEATIAAIRYTQELENLAAVELANARAAEEAQREAERQAAEAQRAADQAEAARIARGESALRILHEEFALFDVTDVVDQLQELGKVLQAGGPVFRQLLGGLDLADPAARSEALTRLQQFAVQNPLGVDSGTFGASTVRQSTLDLAELLKQANAVDVTQGQTGSFAINRSITEASADRISGLIGTTNIILGGMAADLAAIAVVLGAPRVAPLTPPAIPFTGSAGTAVGTASIHIGTIAISMDGEFRQGDPSPRVTDLIRQLSQALAADAARAAMGA